jgi:hypothetical protein
MLLAKEPEDHIAAHPAQPNHANLHIKFGSPGEVAD